MKKLICWLACGCLLCVWGCGEHPRSRFLQLSVSSPRKAACMADMLERSLSSQEFGALCAVLTEYRERPEQLRRMARTGELVNEKTSKAFLGAAALCGK